MTSALSPQLDDETAAWVDGRPIPVRSVRRRRALIVADVGPSRMPVDGSPEDRRLSRWIVQTLIDERLVAAHAEAIGVSAYRPEGHPVSDAVAVAVFESVTADVVVDDARIERYYRANRARYERPERRYADQVVVEHAATAGSIAVAAASQGSLRSVGCSEVEAVAFVAGRVGGELERRVFAAVVPAILGPLRTAAGWHVVQLRAVELGSCEPLASVADAIRRDLLAVARGERFDRWLLGERKRRVRVAVGHGHPGDPRLPDSLHRH